jgi:uncharacterized membrane protein YtjA (UPF0391 family)
VQALRDRSSFLQWNIWQSTPDLVESQWGAMTWVAAWNRLKNESMLYYTIIFLIVALIAGALGFWGLAGLAASIAKILFVVFLVFFVISLISGRRTV